MHALLPDLMLGGCFAIRGAEVGELIEQPLAALRLELGEKHARGEPLEIADGDGQLGTGDDGVEVVVEDDPRSAPLCGRRTNASGDVFPPGVFHAHVGDGAGVEADDEHAAGAGGGVDRPVGVA